MGTLFWIPVQQVEPSCTDPNACEFTGIRPALFIPLLGLVAFFFLLESCTCCSFGKTLLFFHLNVSSRMERFMMNKPFISDHYIHQVEVMTPFLNCLKLQTCSCPKKLAFRRKAQATPWNILACQAQQGGQPTWHGSDGFLQTPASAASCWSSSGSRDNAGGRSSMPGQGGSILDGWGGCSEKRRASERTPPYFSRWHKRSFCVSLFYTPLWASPKLELWNGKLGARSKLFLFLKMGLWE